MLYPIVARQPVKSLLSEQYEKHIAHAMECSYGDCDKNIVFVYSYNTYQNYTVVNSGLVKYYPTEYSTHYVVIFETDKDNIDYAKFMLSDFAIRMTIDGNYIRNTLDCCMFGPYDRKWELFSEEYERVREQLRNSNSREECNQLWDKYFMCNESSRTKEYLNEIKYTDKLYASYILPPGIHIVPFEAANSEFIRTREHYKDTPFFATKEAAELTDMCITTL